MFLTVINVSVVIPNINSNFCRCLKGVKKLTIDRVRIETIMAERQITLGDLAAASGIAKQNISTILRRGNCYPKTAGKLAKGLCVPVVEIAGKLEGA